MNNVMMKPAVPDSSSPVQNICLSDQEIQGSRVYCHWLEKDGNASWDPLTDSIRIFLLICGSVIFENDSVSFEAFKKGVFIGKPGAIVHVRCQADAQILELQRFVTEEEWDFLRDSHQLPFSRTMKKPPATGKQGKVKRPSTVCLFLNASSPGLPWEAWKPTERTMWQSTDILCWNNIFSLFRKTIVLS